jgi:hypothetical protein
VVSAYWTVGDRTVSSCKVGDTVVAHVVLRAEGGPVRGSVTVKVRKDYALLPDKDFKVETHFVSLREGESVELAVAFQPDEPSGDLMRGYFIELEGAVSWTMDDSYPPRLRVTAAPPPAGGPRGGVRLVDCWREGCHHRAGRADRNCPRPRESCRG